MKLSVSSGFFNNCPDRDRYTPSEAVRLLSQAGFEAVEISLADSINEGSYLRQANWHSSIEKIAETAAECGVEISQSHLPFYKFATPGCEELEFRAEMFGRSIEASAMLGVKWAVFHTGNATDAVFSVRESKRRTLEYLNPYLETAARLGVGIAIENLFIPANLNSTHRYCSNVEEVCDIVDTLGEIAGVCWDFGHANLIGDDQRECLRAVGKRLKAVHVHDNNGKRDDHAIPFASNCTVNWAEILPVLGEIGYRGNFNLEVGASRVPQALRASLASYVAQLGRQMMSMIPAVNTQEIPDNKKIGIV